MYRNRCFKMDRIQTISMTPSRTLYLQRKKSRQRMSVDCSRCYITHHQLLSNRGDASRAEQNFHIPNSKRLLSFREDTSQQNVILAHEITHSFSLKSWNQQAFMLKIDLATIHSMISADDLIVYGQTTQEITSINNFFSHAVKLRVKPQSGVNLQSHSAERTKLTGLKADSLSHACRLVYIKSVLASIPIYYMTNVLLPKDLLEKITAIIRNFWWKGPQVEGTTKSICFRAWEGICQPKQLGGLGIKNIATVNKSLVTHSAWLVAAQKDSFLFKVLKSKYHPHISFWNAPLTGSRSVFWFSVHIVKHYIQDNSFYQIHEGINRYVNRSFEPFERSMEGCKSSIKTENYSLEDAKQPVQTRIVPVGIGLFLKERIQGRNFKLKLQVQADHVTAHAILFAMKMNRPLQIHSTTIYSDNQDLITTLNKEDLVLDAPAWDLRPLLASISAFDNFSRCSFSKI
ncbi:hypothetical protein U9M48_003092, partial [Paspalum notatum var. saurae]